MAISYKVPARLQRATLGPWIGGIDEKTESSKIAKHKCADAQNVLLDEVPGSLLKRNGSRELSLLPSGNPARDGTVFKRADGTSYLMASDGEKLYYTVDPAVQASWVLLKSGLNPDGFLEFEVAEDRVWISNGINYVMSWDANTLKIYDRERYAEQDSTAVADNYVENPDFGDVDDHWNGKQLVWTTGNNVGIVVTITDFDQSSKRLTFTPAMPSATVQTTDRFKVGLIIPRFRALRYWDGHLWGVSTPDNPAETRWHRIADPNTGADIDIDHPLAWPPTHQLDIYSADGDRVWGISPVLRDRILMFKSTGIFRIERDPLTHYTVEVVERAIGSRFPRTWQEKKNLFYFMGQDKDGLPDIYKTDMVEVSVVDDDSGLEPTLNSLRQPNAVQRISTFSAKADFAAGDQSDLLTLLTGDLALESIDSQVEWADNVEASNIYIDPTLHTIEASTPGLIEDFESWNGNGWTISGSMGVESRYGSIRLTNRSTSPWVLNGYVEISQNDAYGEWEFNVATMMSDFNVTYAEFFFVYDSANPSSNYYIRISGPNGTTMSLYKGAALLSSVSVGSMLNSPQTVRITRDSSGKIDVYHGAALKISVTDNTHKVSTHTRIYIVSSNQTTNGVAWVDDVKLPRHVTTNDYIKQFDYKIAPANYGRFWVDAEQFGNGTYTLATLSSDSTDFTTGVDPAGYKTFANGGLITSALKRYLRIRITLNGVKIHELIGSALWRSQSIFIGQNIADWKTFLATIDSPGNSLLSISIRAATVLTAPIELDWGSWNAIVDGNDIGTVLADGAPPASRWVQIKVELGPTDAGTKPILEAFSLQWVEGQEKALPVHAVTHKKRYMVTAAYSTSAENDVVIVNDRNEAWIKYAGWNLNLMVHFGSRLIGFCSVNDKILELDFDSYSDLGQAIDAFIITRREAMGANETRKDLRFSYLHVGDIAGTLEVGLKKVGNTVFSLLKNFTLAGDSRDRRQNFPIATISKWFQRRYRNAVLGEGMELNSEDIYYTHRNPKP